MGNNVEQVRYGKFEKGKHKGQRRSVLVTVRRGDVLYFGISKCHKKLDKWDREQGLRLARARVKAQLSSKNPFRNADNWVALDDDADFNVHKEERLFGCCHVNKAKKLMKYFSEVSLFFKQDQES